MTSKGDNDTQSIGLQFNENFQSFLESLAYPSVIHSNGKFVYVNKPAAKLLKVSSTKALIGKSTLNIFHKDFKKVTQDLIMEVYENGFTPEKENLIVDRTGKRIMVQLTGTLIDYKGKPSVLFTLQDQGGLRKAEPQLQITEQQYGQLVENISEGIIKFDAKEIITYVNKRFCELVGFSAKELVGKAGHQLLFTTKDAKKIVKQVRKERLQGESSTYEVQILTKSNKLIWVSINGMPILGEDGTYAGAMELVTDISSSKMRDLDLELSEQRFTGLSKATFDAVAIHDQGEILMVNDAFHELFGFKPSEVIGRMVTEFCTPESREILMDYTLKQKEDAYVAMGLKKDKSTFFAEICGKSIVYQGRKARVATIRDITDQKLSADALMESRKRFASLYDNANDLIQNLDPQGKFLLVNDAWLTTLGYSKSDLQKITFFDIVHPESLESCIQILERVINGETVQDIEMAFAKKDGNIVQVRGNMTPEVSNKGSIMIQGIFANVTEDWLVKSKQKNSEARYLALLDNMNEGVLQVDNEENIEYVNNRFCEMCGYTMDELVGSNANVLLSVSRKASKTMKNKIDERKQGVSSRYEFQIKVKNGGIIWVNASGAPLYDFDGNVVGSIGINTDITQRKKVEAELESLSRFPSENPMPVLRYSIDQKDFIYCNKSGESIVRRLNQKKNLTLKRHWQKLFQSAYGKNKSIQEELQDASVLYMCNIVPVQQSHYVNVYMSDITEERVVEGALLDSNEKFRSLVENMNEGVIRINSDHIIEYVNYSFCQILGYSQKELLGNNHFDVLTVDEDSMKAIKSSVTRRKKGMASKYELKHQRKSGEWIWVTINGTPLHDDKGAMVGSMVIMTDITNQKMFEEEIGALNAGLEDRVEERTVELGKANLEIRALFKEMHHRVKNNLQIVSSLLSLQASRADNEYVTQVFRDSQDRLQTMSSIHESLYLNESMSELNVKDYLDQLVRDRVRISADILNTVVVDVKFPDITFNIETMLPLGLLLNELVTNSLKHAFPNNQEGVIMVEIKILKGKSFVLYYGDTGVGFSDENTQGSSKSIGLVLIDSFTMQLDGELKHLDKPGTHYEFKFNSL